MGSKKYFIKNKQSQHIEAEEIFLDSEAIRSIEEKGKLEKPIKERTFIIFYLVIIACLLGLLGRAVYLQAAKGAYYLDLALGNKLRIYSLSAPRGIIYDYQNQPLVYNVPNFELTIILADFLANPEQTQEIILEKVAGLIEEPAEILKQKIKGAGTKTSQLTLAGNISQTAALTLEGLIGDWPGVRLEKNNQRSYIFAPYFAHLVGYTGKPNQLELKEHSDYLINDQIGKAGLELFYDFYLRGSPGEEQVEIDATGRTKKLLAVKPAQPGDSLTLFLDAELQKKIYQSLNQMLSQLRLKKAAAVALNPQNGGILALVSLPSFDSNLFSQKISVLELDNLSRDPNQPFLNRAVSGTYPPGSTIKPLIGAAALEEKIVKPNQTIDCQGGLTIPNQYYPEIVYNFPDWKAHGITDIIKAIAESCNVYFYTISGGYGQIKGLGAERIKRYLGLFGLEQSTNIDLPFEAIGLIPDKTWKKKVKPDEEWFLGDTYHLGIGQGDILVTPLQLAAAIGAIANGGVLYQPQLVDKIIDSKHRVVDDIRARVVRQDFIKTENIKVIQRGMREAVVSGSVSALANLTVKAAGKTGTAQFGSGQSHAWFVGYAPYNDPEMVLVILVEAGGEGHQAAVPVAKEVWEWYFERR